MDYSDLLPVLVKCSDCLDNNTYNLIQVGEEKWIYNHRQNGYWTFVYIDRQPLIMDVSGRRRDGFREVLSPTRRLKYKGKKVFTYRGIGSVGPIEIHNPGLFAYFLLTFK